MTEPTFALVPAAYNTGSLYSVYPLAGGGDWTFIRTSEATRVNKAGLVEIVTDDIARLDYSNGDCPELLLERASTNLITYSEDLTQWSKFSSGGTTPIVTANQSISPDGTLTADKIEFFNDGVAIVTINGTVDPLEEHSLSIWMKGEVGGEIIEIHCKNISSQGLGSQAYTLTTEWARYKLEGITPLQASAGLQLRNTSTNTAKTFYAWGGQLEETIVTTSYIPVVASTATRSIDRLTDLTTIDVSSDDFTLFFDIDLTDLAVGFGSLSINDGDDATHLRITNNTSTGGLSISNRVLSTVENSYLMPYSTYGYKVKVGIVSTNSGMDIYINGGLASSLTSGVIDMSTMTNIGFTDGQGDNFLGRLKDFRYYDTKLSSTELTILTKQ